jgi:LPXTG-site transpeptidase (sortase) family protein
MQIKRKRRSRSSIILIVLIILLVIGGITLIAYPFLTDIPNIIGKGSQIAGWQTMRDKLAGKSQQTPNSSTLTETTIMAATETTVKTETTELTTQTSINGQEALSQDSTTTTKKTDSVIGKENTVKYTAIDIFPAKLTIPKINLEWITNEGSDVPDLKKGPGHIPQTPLPGEAGRCTLSGHRTTYGAPFNRLDDLKKGDMIYLEALNGNKYFYQVTSFQIVMPNYVQILNGTNRKELLLTTCYPEYSARERFVVIAELVTVFPLDLNLKQNIN